MAWILIEHPIKRGEKIGAEKTLAEEVSQRIAELEAEWERNPSKRPARAQARKMMQRAQAGLAKIAGENDYAAILANAARSLRPISNDEPASSIGVMKPPGRGKTRI